MVGGHALYTPGLSERRNGSSLFYNSDNLGNLWSAEDGTGQAEAGAWLFTGFGAPLYTGTGAGNASPLKYGGANNCQTDYDTGLVLMGHRYYDVRTGRFISQDPAGDGDNWYAYAGNSPTNKVDPTGQYVENPMPNTDQTGLFRPTRRLIPARRSQERTRGQPTFSSPARTHLETECAAY